MNERTLRISMRAMPIIVICAFAIEGVILPAAPIRGVHISHFDGHGNLRQLDWVLVAGAPIRDGSAVTGTYNINADCSGTINLIAS